MDLKNIIQINYQGLTKKEKYIADYILNNTEQAKNMNIFQLAEVCDVAESTISLFAQDIGLSGFKELTVLLANSHKNLLLNSVNKDDDLKVITEKVFTANMQSLKDALRLIEYDELSGGIKLLRSSQKIVFFALGGSASIALDAYHKFLRTPLEVEYNMDYHMQLLNAGNLNNKSCAIIISYSGTNPDILRIVKLLSENQVPIISITSFDNTPLVKFSKFTFLTPTEELGYKNTQAYARRLSMMAFIDLLFTLLIATKKDEVISHLEQIKRSFDSTR